MDIKNFQLEHDRQDTKVFKVGDFFRKSLSNRVKYIVDNYGIFENLMEGSLDEHFDAYNEGFCKCFYVKGMVRNFACYSEWLQAFWYKMRLVGEDPLKMYWKTKNCLGLFCQILNHLDNKEFELKIENYTFIKNFIDVLFFSVTDKINELNGDPNPVRDLWFMEDFSF